MTSVLETRIDDILDRKVFPSGKAWSLAAGLSPNYLGTLKTRLRQGKGMRGGFPQIEALARAAGVAAGWLYGSTDISTDGGDPLFGNFFLTVRLRPGLAEALEREPLRWHTTTVLQALQFNPERVGGDGDAVSRWVEVLDSVELSRYEPIVGTATDVIDATKEQIGERPSLPELPKPVLRDTPLPTGRTRSRLIKK